MMKKCFDEGLLQAFLDNELTSEMSQDVARHVAACDPCAVLLAEIEEETSIAFGALEQEFNTLVPTRRLWTKINASIEAENKSRAWWQRIFQPVSVFWLGLSKPSMAALASLIFVFAVFAVLLATKKDNLPTVATTAQTPNDVRPIVENKKTDEIIRPFDEVPVDEKNPIPENKSNAPRFVKADFVKTNVSPQRKPEANRDFVTPQTRTTEYIDGELSYVKTISRLEKTVNQNKDAILSPTARFAYEKDLAVVDDAIRRMKREVKKNPKNESAKQVLFSSYQNKIELLSSVSERAETVAGLR